MSGLHADVSAALGGLSVRRSERVLVALSGGADSVALLHLLLALGQRVAVGHVHHGLRAAADGDAAFVASLARCLGVAWGERRVEAGVADGRSPEARARALRYPALEQLRQQLGCRWIATAHTLDDQAETVLLRALRGTGLDGLAGIDDKSRERHLIRPLLGQRRAGLRDSLRARNLDWREDESNRDLSLPRNRLRAEVLPVLEQIHPGASARLASLAELAREARDAGRAELGRALADASREGGAGLWIDPEALAELDPLLRSRALRALLARAGLGERITRRHLSRVQSFLASARRGAALSLPGQRSLVRRGERFWLGPWPAGREDGAARERRT